MPARNGCVASTPVSTMPTETPRPLYPTDHACDYLDERSAVGEIGPRQCIRQHPFDVADAVGENRDARRRDVNRDVRNRRVLAQHPVGPPGEPCEQPRAASGDDPALCENGSDVAQRGFGHPRATEVPVRRERGSSRPAAFCRLDRVGESAGAGRPAIDGASLDSNTTNAERTATNIPTGTTEEFLSLIVSAPVHALHTTATAEFRNGRAAFVNACQDHLVSRDLRSILPCRGAPTDPSGDLSHDSE